MKSVCCMLVAALGLSACNGTVKSRLWTQADLRRDASSPEGIKGVLGYNQRPIIELDQMTQLVDKDGKPIAAACDRIQVRKIVMINDYDHPIEIWYEPGLLEANTFSVQLSSGNFTAINSTSTPDQGKTLLNLTEAAKNIAPMAGLKAKEIAPETRRPTGLPACNAGPSFIGYEPLPPISG